jgi:4-hydroxybenzoate polyprenyltransferase
MANGWIISQRLSLVSKPAWISIFRPINGLFLLLIPCWLSFGFTQHISTPAVLWALGIVIIATGGYLQNFKDDNKHQTLSLSSSPWFLGGAICLTILSIITQQWLFLSSGILASFMLFFYSTHLKNRGLLGNIAIALLSAWTIIGLALILIFTVNNVDFSTLLVLAFLSFLTTLNREWMKDVEDVEEDLELKRTTIPIRFGNKFTFLLNLVIALPIGIYLFLVAQEQSLWLAVLLIIWSVIWTVSAMLIFKYPAQIRRYQLFIKLCQLIMLLCWPFIHM